MGDSEGKHVAAQRAEQIAGREVAPVKNSDRSWHFEKPEMNVPVREEHKGKALGKG